VLKISKNQRAKITYIKKKGKRKREDVKISIIDRLMLKMTKKLIK